MKMVLKDTKTRTDFDNVQKPKVKFSIVFQWCEKKTFLNGKLKRAKSSSLWEMSWRADKLLGKDARLCKNFGNMRLRPFWHGCTDVTELTVFENQRKSLFQQLRAKQAKVTFWVDKSSLKMPKMVHFGDFFENLKLAVKQCYQTGQF